MASYSANLLACCQIHCPSNSCTMEPRIPKDMDLRDECKDRPERLAVNFQIVVNSFFADVGSVFGCLC